MIPIEKYTILRPGDILVQPDNNEKWKIIKIEGHNFFVANLSSGKEGYVEKNLLCIEPKWHFEIGDGRKYY